jgi:hypothetical protein
LVFEEEGSEARIDAVEVVVVDHRRGGDQPRVARSRARIAPALGAHHPSLLLGLADEQDPLATRELPQIRLGHRLLALPLLEGDHLDPVLLGEPLDRGHECPRHRRHQRGGCEEVFAMLAEEVRNTSFRLQNRDVDVEVHPVDALQLERYVAL